MLPGAEQILAHDGISPVAARVFCEQHVAETCGIAVVGQCVFRSVAAFERCGVLIEIAGLANEVKGNIGDGDILLQHGAMAAPFAVAVTEDQGVISQVAGIVDKL